MADFYADENFDRATVDRLRALGHDVLTVQDAGRQGGTDAAVLAYATVRGRAVLTLNRRHFVRLHAQAASHAGILVCTHDAPDALAVRIDEVVRACGVLDNHLLRVNRPP